MAEIWPEILAMDSHYVAHSSTNEEEAEHSATSALYDGTSPCYPIDPLKGVYGKSVESISIDCVEFCKVMADDTRQRILVMLREGERCVGDIVDAFDMSQPTISHHLGMLKRLGLVTSRKDGKLVYYSLNQENVVTCCGLLVAKFDFEEPCEAR